MKHNHARFGQWIGTWGLLAGSFGALQGCSTTQITAPPPPQATPPPFVQVPHPRGNDASELQSIMLSKDFPGSESLKDCDQDGRKIIDTIKNEIERKQAFRELVRRDPVMYHWCFYQKSWNAEESVRSEAYINDKQKTVLQQYAFLVPIARAYMAEYRDSRYLRWSVTQYRRFSERVFFRKVEITPEATSELVQISNPFGLWRSEEPTSSVLEKYNIIPTKNPNEFHVQPVAAETATPAVPPVPERAPASTESASPDTVPATEPAAKGDPKPLTDPKAAVDEDGFIPN